MKWMTFGVFTLAMLGAVSTVSTTAAPDRPSLAGSWMSPDQRHELRITQDASQLSVTQTRGGLGEKLVYRLDGSDSRNETETVTGEKWAHVSRARWVGPAVVITTTTTRGSTGRSWDWMTTYFLTSDGNLSVATLDGVLTSDQAMDLRTTAYRKR